MKRLLFLGILFAAPAAAQSGTTRAASTITPGDIARRIGIIADDSMMGRDTPSRGLELTAQYVASEFKRLGLKPGGDSGAFIQRYPVVRRRLDPAYSSIVFRGDVEIPVSFASDAYVLLGNPSADVVRGSLVLLGGVVDPSQIPGDQVKDAIVLWVIDFTRPAPGNASAVLSTLFSSGARALVVISNRDSAAFNSRMASNLKESVTTEGGGMEGNAVVIEVREAAISSVYPQAADQFAQLRTAPATVVMPIPDWTGELTIKLQVVGSRMVPNTIGILEGTDSRLKNEYLIYSAHMDHIGITPGKADSINNGADDDGSGTVGVLELAEAYATRGARPKRSVIFMTVSGEEKGLWGSAYFTEHPTVPLKDVIADLNIDMVGRNWKDTVVAIGMQHSDLGTTLTKVGQAHRELGMTPIDDIWPEENLYSRSDHFNFARKGVPILFFTSGLHRDYHQVTDSPDKIDSEKESRILKLLFFLGEEVANSPNRPQWNPQSYQQIVQQAGSE